MRRWRQVNQKKRKLPAVVCLSAVLCLMPGMSSPGAVRSYSVEAENRIRTGDVNISLEEYELDEDGREVPYQDGKTVVPGQTVDKIVKIKNEAENVWVRAKAEYETDGPAKLDDSALKGIGEKWIRAGEYFYYTEPLEEGETILFFRQLTVPPEWDEAAAGMGFSAAVTAQAVQADNFTPDFEEEFPWFGIPVEKCVHDGYERDSGGDSQEFAIIFENGSEGFVRTGEDFFQNFSALMPGDRVTDSVELGNRYSRNIDLYFRTEIPDQSEAGRELLEQLQLTIRKGDQTVYSGPLSGKELAEEILLSENLKKGDCETLTYEVYMPEELTNISAQRQAAVRWIFRAEYRDLPEHSSGGGSGGSKVREVFQSPEQKEIPVQIPELIQEFVGELLPKTGESLHLGLWLTLTAGGVLLLAGLLTKRKQ